MPFLLPYYFPRFAMDFLKRATSHGYAANFVNIKDTLYRQSVIMVNNGRQHLIANAIEMDKKKYEGIKCSRYNSVHTKWQ